MEVKAEAQLTNEEARDLVGAKGIMSLMDAPAVAASGAELAMNTFSQVLRETCKNGGGGGRQAKPKPAKSEEASVEPHSALQRANELCNELLKRGGEAQKLASQIEPLQFSSDLVSFLKKFHNTTMLIYKKVWPLVVKQATVSHTHTHTDGNVESFYVLHA